MQSDSHRRGPESKSTNRTIPIVDCLVLYSAPIGDIIASYTSIIGK